MILQTINNQENNENVLTNVTYQYAKHDAHTW